MKTIAICLLVLATFVSTIWSDLPDANKRVVILANSNDLDSLKIAKYYAQQRSIPEANIISLAMPITETIKLQQYIDMIHRPLFEALVASDWIQAVRSGQLDSYGRDVLFAAVHQISYLVTVRGVPLRISNDIDFIEPESSKIPSQFRVNCGSVDGELALLAIAERLSMTGFIANPYFQKMMPTSRDLSFGIRVSRLDGPTLKSVCNLIDSSIEAEKNGLRGRAYFDTGGPHELGDRWIDTARKYVIEEYYDTDTEDTKRKIDARDRLDAPAIYMGWYSTSAYGPWLNYSRNVPAGSIGFHLHSFSATTVRSVKKGWLGPLIEQGYCATFGNVYEPYLQFTHRPDLFMEMLLKGSSFGEAIAYCTPRWSWMAVAIGDPLYRPFSVDLDKQLDLIDGTKHSAYVVLRELLRLEKEASEEVALNFAKEQFINKPSLVLSYSLAQLYQKCGELENALEVLKLIRFLAVFSIDERVLAQKVADLLHQLGDSELAYAVYVKLINSHDNPKPLKVQLLESGALLARSIGNLEQARQWSLLVNQLKLPSTDNNQDKGK